MNHIAQYFYIMVICSGHWPAPVIRYISKVKGSTSFQHFSVSSKRLVRTSCALQNWTPQFYLNTFNKIVINNISNTYDKWMPYFWRDLWWEFQFSIALNRIFSNTTKNRRGLLRECFLVTKILLTKILLKKCSEEAATSESKVARQSKPIRTTKLEV